ncbi:hypothetical protein N9901_02860 [Flavobacteriaceae bacterium]|nr:hypothetical protein [Flavobacteriaceae bacterium]
MNKVLQKGIALGVIMVLFSVIGYIFWLQEFQYYRQVKPIKEEFKKELGDTLNITGIKPPAFLHFYDNDCISSKVNIEHLQLFVKSPVLKMSYYIVMLHKNQDTTALRLKYKIPSFVKFVTKGANKLAKNCGVLTTPHAVVVTNSSTLYFSGNYNSKTGLCTSSNISVSAPATALLFYKQGIDTPLFPSFLTNPWGCAIE